MDGALSRKLDQTLVEAATKFWSSTTMPSAVPTILLRKLRERIGRNSGHLEHFGVAEALLRTRRTRCSTLRRTISSRLQPDPQGTIRANVEGTQRLLDAVAKTSTVQRLVFTSTAAVYAPDERAHSESLSLVQPDTFTANTKLWGEHLVHAFTRRQRSTWALARLFNVFGRR